MKAIEEKILNWVGDGSMVKSVTIKIEAATEPEVIVTLINLPKQGTSDIIEYLEKTYKLVEKVYV